MVDIVFFGSLRSVKLLEVVISKKIIPRDFEEARIINSKLFRVKNENFPYLIKTKSKKDIVNCVVIKNLNDLDFNKIKFYESVEYTLDEIKVEINNSIQKYNYFKFIKKNITNEEWIYEEWQRKFEESNCKAAFLWMKLYDKYKKNPGEAEKFWPDMQKKVNDELKKRRSKKSLSFFIKI